MVCGTVIGSASDTPSTEITGVWLLVLCTGVTL
jgi:hypothetical protein